MESPAFSFLDQQTSLQRVPPLYGIAPIALVMAHN
jgi:hypothetical protein